MRARKVFLFLCTSITVLIIAALIWTRHAENKAHIEPDYPQVDLTEILKKAAPDEADYELLALQTGLSEAGIRTLWEQGRQQELLVLQQRLFAPVEMVCRANTIISREEKLIEGIEGVSFAQVFPVLEEGDILISFNSHVLGWRCGHAAIVVDAREGNTMEALVLGTDSATLSMRHWVNYPSVAVLRVKGLTLEQRQAVAAYAQENLQGIPYRLLARKWQVEDEVQIQTTGTAITEFIPDGTHCAHLIWAAYAPFGYDLDSDGGAIVTPADIFESEQVEIIQIYGMETEMVNP